MVKRISFLVLLFYLNVCSADWGTDFYRFQCIPEIGRIYVDTFYIDNPDDFGHIKMTGPNDGVFSDLEKEHEIFTVTTGVREHECSLNGNKIHFIFKFGSNSQGQSTGSLTATLNGKIVIDRLNLFAYYGYAPLVRNIEISVGGRPPVVFSSFDVVGETGSPNFSFGSRLDEEKPITNMYIGNESKRRNQ